jgi:hypothetical protein
MNKRFAVQRIFPFVWTKVLDNLGTEAHNSFGSPEISTMDPTTKLFIMGEATNLNVMDLHACPYGSCQLLWIYANNLE